MLPVPPTAHSGLSVLAELVCVPPEPAWIEALWMRAKPFIRRAVDATDLITIEEIERDVLAGRMLLWLALENNELLAAGVTELRRTQHSLSCVIIAYAGRQPRDWPALLQKIE